MPLNISQLAQLSSLPYSSCANYRVELFKLCYLRPMLQAEALYFSACLRDFVTNL